MKNKKVKINKKDSDCKDADRIRLFYECQNKNEESCVLHDEKYTKWYETGEY